MNFRIGFGYDIHQLVENHPFWLGGVRIEHTKGAFGHSDADVLIHAIIDALLGAANLRDIGFHFPDTSEEFKGIDSKVLLRKTMSILESHDFSVGNIDCTICLQQPKVKDYIDDMRTSLCSVMEIEEKSLSIKATTSEKMGFVGREEGVKAYAVALVYS